MRYAVLSDIHANLGALRAVPDGLPRRGVDRYLVAGDLVGYGRQPNACVELQDPVKLSSSLRRAMGGCGGGRRVVR
jgi:predicted phosphodiesterase